MITVIENQNIALSNADAIVNASNGIGYMGGQRCIDSVHRGVAEHIQYVSKGAVELLSREICKKKSYFWGYKAGSIFLTEAPNMNTNYIIHAVTMRFPGSNAKLKTINVLIPEIIKIAEKMNFKQVAIPLLGTGTGGLSEEKVFSIYEQILTDSDIEFLVYKNYKIND